MPDPKPAPPPARLAILGRPLTTHALSQRIAETDGGRRYRLFRAEPRAAPPPTGWPVLYLLDGNAAFDALTPELLAAVPDLALVGVGYETEARFDVAQRWLDYTPLAEGTAPRPDPERPERMIGGAQAFLERLCGPLRQEAERGWPVDPDRRSLWGHSMAALFTLYALLKRPGAFRAYAAASPSLWWGERVLFAIESAAPPARAAKILVMLGDAERRSSAAGPHWDGPSPHTLEMAERLRARPRLAVTTRIFAGAGHAQTLPASLPHALALAAERTGRVEDGVTSE